MIYLDHAAATPLDPRVLKAMLPYLKGKFANPSSVYQFALQNRQAIDAARKSVATVLHCDPHEIYFTSGGTESNNWAIFGGVTAQIPVGSTIITAVAEHDSVLKPFEELERRGWPVTFLNIDAQGHINNEELVKSLKPDTVFVSIAYANNEIGTIENIAAIATLVKKHSPKAFFHTDACQAAGALPLSVRELGIDLMTLNGGKIYGPKGSGILYIRDGIKIMPLLYGGGQEHRQRAGTENIAAIVGFAEALKIAEQLRVKESARLMRLRDKLIAGLQQAIPGATLNGEPERRLPNNINMSFPGIDAESLLLRLDMAGICASAGSACTSGALEPSHVLLALGVEKNLAGSSIRMTLGRENTEKDIQKLLKIIPPIIEDLNKNHNL